MKEPGFEVFMRSCQPGLDFSARPLQSLPLIPSHDQAQYNSPHSLLLPVYVLPSPLCSPLTLREECPGFRPRFLYQ